MEPIVITWPFASKEEDPPAAAAPPITTDEDKEKEKDAAFETVSDPLAGFPTDDDVLRFVNAISYARRVLEARLQLVQNHVGTVLLRQERVDTNEQFALFRMRVTAVALNAFVEDVHMKKYRRWYGVLNWPAVGCILDYVFDEAYVEAVCTVIALSAFSTTEFHVEPSIFEKVRDCAKWPAVPISRKVASSKRVQGNSDYFRSRLEDIDEEGRSLPRRHYWQHQAEEYVIDPNTPCDIQQCYQWFLQPGRPRTLFETVVLQYRQDGPPPAESNRETLLSLAGSEPEPSEDDAAATLVAEPESPAPAPSPMSKARKKYMDTMRKKRAEALETGVPIQVGPFVRFQPTNKN